MATINMHMKFEIEIPKQTWLMLRKPCRLQTDRRTDGQTDKVNPVYPPSNFVGRGYKDTQDQYMYIFINIHSISCPMTGICDCRRMKRVSLLSIHKRVTCYRDGIYPVTHWGWDKIAAIWQTAFSNIFSYENIWISPNISLKFVPKVWINNIPALVQMMAWHRTDNKSWSKPKLFSLLMDIYITWTQWVKDVCHDWMKEYQTVIHEFVG